MTSRSGASPSIPGMLMSERITISSGPRCRPDGANPPRPRRRNAAHSGPWRTSRRKRWRNRSCRSGSSSTIRMLYPMSLSPTALSQPAAPLSPMPGRGPRHTILPSSTASGERVSIRPPTVRVAAGAGGRHRHRPRPRRPGCRRWPASRGARHPVRAPRPSTEQPSSRPLSLISTAPKSPSPRATTAAATAARSQRRINALIQIPVLSRGFHHRFDAPPQPRPGASGSRI